MMMYPLVSLFDENGKMQHLTYFVAMCDWCGKHLPDDYVELDNSIRPLYFCSKKCEKEFNIKYPKNTNSYPSIKLSVKGLTTPLKFYETDEAIR
jgi:ribosomal protein L24E